MPIVLKSGSLNLLGPSGLVQACNGIVLLYKRRDILPYENFFFNFEERVPLHIIFELPVSNVKSRKINFLVLNKAVEKKKTDFCYVLTASSGILRRFD